MNVNYAPFSDTLKTAALLVDSAITDGGVTIARYAYDRSTTGVPSGYVVGGKAPGIRVNSGVKVSTLHSRVSAWIQALPSNVKFLGSWFDEDESVYYFDAVDILFSRELSIGLAENRGEKAIYDNASGEVIDVSKPHSEMVIEAKGRARHDSEKLNPVLDAPMISWLDKKFPGYLEWISGRSDYNPLAPVDPAGKSGREYSIIPQVYTNSWYEGRDES